MANETNEFSALIFHDLKHLLNCSSYENLALSVGKISHTDVIILDHTFQVSGICTQKDSVIPEEFSFKMGMYISSATKHFSKLCSAFEQSQHLNSTVVLKNLITEKCVVCKTVFDKNCIIGYILLIASHDQYSDFFIFTAESASLGMAKIFYSQNKEYPPDTLLLSELVSNKKVPEEIINQWLEQMHWKPSDYIYVIVIRNPVGKVLPPDIVHQFDILSSDRALIFDYDLVWIMTQPKRLEGFDIERIEPLNKKLKELNLYAGLSRRCPAIGSLYTSYRQAVCSLEKCIYNQEPNLHIMPYIDTWIDDLLNEIYPLVDLKKYCTPQLTALETYDKKTNSDLLNTLICYFEHNQNLKETSEAMYLHRNTVKYRLSKCEEILETDLNNMNRNLGIYFSLKVISFLKNKSRQ